MEETTVRAGSVELRVRRTGSGEPLLLLHGVTDSGACWSRVAADLADGFAVVAADARGHGRSSRIGQGFGVEDQVEDAAAVLRATADGPVAVWGHSMGAATAAALAAAHPELVSRVVLEDPPFSEDGDDGPSLEEVRGGIGRMLAEVRAAAPADRIRLARASNPDWDAAELPGWVESKLQFDDQVLDEPIIGGDWRATAERIEAPVLLVTGDPDRGAIVTPSTAAAFAALHPGTALLRFPGAGHNVHREAYDEVLAAVRDFLGSGN
ncbi:alpha/beta fold hydrolase [Amnibacterium kyonggiense]|uniref:Lipase n=1 Tax=Amnibacterium kyonggiense TaxID=595671 RepID=A0A4R7FIE3_9MICO|nr:alpha/beta hydrolase [Amnibacterium kyonggiense]TDS75841.1 lipase [Amnibacterium kyonggiense]